jgi:hypothetical protein
MGTASVRDGILSIGGRKTTLNREADTLTVEGTEGVYQRVKEPSVTVTIKNNRSHDMWVAFCLQGFGSPNDVSRGWYTVKAGEARRIAFKNNIRSSDGVFGYYAAGGGSIWQGDGGLEYWIHRKDAFTGGSSENGSPISGGEIVSFLSANLTKVSETEGEVTLTFDE